MRVDSSLKSDVCMYVNTAWGRVLGTDTHAHTHIYIYMHTYIHTYIQTYIHTYVDAAVSAVSRERNCVRE